MVSVIIPVYNEESTIRKVLGALTYKDCLEVIVVDGESQDRTREFARTFPARVVGCTKNRALQMNKGAQLATRDALVFLHADCWLEEGSLRAISDCLEDGCVGGCLTQRIDSNKFIYRLIGYLGNIRARMSKIFYGDQAIFVRRDVFFKLGGFDNLLLFEDILFSKKLMREGQTRILDKRVFSSPRRWQKNGIVITTIIFWFLTLGLSLGISFDRLKRLYQDIR